MSDAVTRLNAALEGRYAIERELGEGGMATVYLADDLGALLKPQEQRVMGHAAVRRAPLSWICRASA